MFSLITVKSMGFSKYLLILYHIFILIKLEKTKHCFLGKTRYEIDFYFVMAWLLNMFYLIKYFKVCCILYINRVYNF